MSTDTKKGLICITLAAGLAWVVLYLIKKEKNQENPDQPVVSQQGITAAVTAYQTAMQEGDSAIELDQMNEALKKEFGVTVEYRPVSNKYYVYDLTGKKVKEV